MPSRWLADDGPQFLAEPRAGQRRVDRGVPRGPVLQHVLEQLGEVEHLHPVVPQGVGELIVLVLRPVHPGDPVQQQPVLAAGGHPPQLRSRTVDEDGAKAADLTVHTMGVRHDPPSSSRAPRGRALGGSITTSVADYASLRKDHWTVSAGPEATRRRAAAAGRARRGQARPTRGAACVGPHSPARAQMLHDGQPAAAQGGQGRPGRLRPGGAAPVAHHHLQAGGLSTQAARTRASAAGGRAGSRC